MPGWHPLWQLALPPHLTFDLLAVIVGLLLARRRPTSPRTPLPVTAIALVGAVVGARLLGLLVDPTETWSLRGQLGGWMQQKTVVGGILGGWLGVEVAKHRLGITRSTGNTFVTPLLVAMAVGRLGCFFSGVTDRTHGTVSALPWAMDLGDGTLRHPLALYEIGVLAGLGAMLHAPRLSGHHRWRLFVLGYCVWRVVSAPLAPPSPVIGPLTTIQIASLVGILAACWGLWRGTQAPEHTPSGSS